MRDDVTNTRENLHIPVFLVSGAAKMSFRTRGLTLLFSKLGYRSGFRASSRTFRPPRANPRAPLSAGSVFFRETRHGGTIDSFRFSGDDGGTTIAAVNGNPFGDVHAKFSHSTAVLSRTLIIRNPSRAAILQLLQLPRRVSARGLCESRRCSRKDTSLSLFFFQASSGLCRIAFFYFIVEKTNFLVPKLRALPRSGLGSREKEKEREMKEENDE